MSEKILQALTQLFAIITKQDGGATEVERKFVIDYFIQELDQDSVQAYTKLYDDVSEFGKPQPKGPMPVKESVRILRFCRQINRNLEQRQKVIILIKLLELVASDKNFSPQRMGVIDTVARAFNIKDDYNAIESFVLCENSSKLNSPDILVASSSNTLISPDAKYFSIEELHGEIIFIRVESVDLYFVKYVGDDDVRLSGFSMKRNQIYLFSNGGSIKAQRGKSIYYGDITAVFLENLQDVKLSFVARDITFKFPNGAVGIQRTNISEPQGKLVGIMGGSGAGKTTLMNVLAGLEDPSSGAVLINGINLHEEKDRIEGVIGYIAQDDLLIEELTVYQNLYYNAKLTFDHLSEKEIDGRVMDTLASLGLDHIRDITVGNVLNKKISGGQRKRLNIALELIREPAVMFVDEPTSGLSSKDSQNVIDLLKELSLKGKLIYVVIHQPSSDIYKTFDKMIILDKGGYLIYYGNPIEAIAYFKRETNQADSERWSENPEEIFNLIEKEVVNEFGQETGKRQLTPRQWHERFLANFDTEEVTQVNEKPPSSLNRPNIFKQGSLFTIRDFLAKVSNLQYLLLNLLEAPVLAILLAFVIRFQNSPDGEGNYVYQFNDNIPAYILICIIIALFMGLTVSAEEIIKDLKIQKRERFLNLSRFGYLSSKIIILFLLSAIQTFSFVLIGNAILGIQGELFTYWIVLFSVSCFANVLGLNISATFNSVITIYITIPLLLIPQMILSGIIFRYDKMNKMISDKGKVPLVADIMTSRWAFEAIMVDHFINNTYERDYYDLEKEFKQTDFIAEHWVRILKESLETSLRNKNSGEEITDSIRQEIQEDLTLIKYEINTKKIYPEFLPDFDLDESLTYESFNADVEMEIQTYLDSVQMNMRDRARTASENSDKLEKIIQEKRDSTYERSEVKKLYYNDAQESFVVNTFKPEIEEYRGKLFQPKNQIYHTPLIPTNPLNYRTDFMVPQKPFMGYLWDTYYFNIAVIWFMTFLLYVSLYFNFFKNIGLVFNKLQFSKKE